MASSAEWRPLWSKVSARLSRQVTRVAMASEASRASSGWGVWAMMRVKTARSVIRPRPPTPRKRSGRGKTAKTRRTGSWSEPAWQGISPTAPPNSTLLRPMTPSTGGRPLWHRFRLAIGPLSRYPRHPWQAFLNVGLASGCEFAARRDTVKRPSIRRGGRCRDRVDAVTDAAVGPLLGALLGPLFGPFARPLGRSRNNPIACTVLRPDTALLYEPREI